MASTSCRRRANCSSRLRIESFIGNSLKGKSEGLGAVQSNQAAPQKSRWTESSLDANAGELSMAAGEATDSAVVRAQHLRCASIQPWDHAYTSASAHEPAFQ